MCASLGGSLKQNVEEDYEDNVEPGWGRLLVRIFIPT